MGYNLTILHRSSKFMKDDDALNRQYSDNLNIQCMVKSASLHNDSFREHPESHIVPSLHYLTRKLAAAPSHLEAS
jgi:hypothetical protein